MTFALVGRALPPAEVGWRRPKAMLDAPGVGNDLQDLFGVRPSTIVAAGQLQDAYFIGGTAQSVMATLGRQRDGILVSAETAHDFLESPRPVLLCSEQKPDQMPFHSALPSQPDQRTVINRAGLS